MQVTQDDKRVGFSEVPVGDTVNVDSQGKTPFRTDFVWSRTIPIVTDEIGFLLHWLEKMLQGVLIAEIRLERHAKKIVANYVSKLCGEK